jgi:aminotransferase
MFPEDYYARLAEDYRAKRDAFLPGLLDIGFKCNPPRGAYYVMADGSGFGFADDVALSLELVKNAGVAVVPGSSFFSNPADGKNLVRFCFCKKEDTLQEATKRLRAWAASF